MLEKSLNSYPAVIKGVFGAVAGFPTEYKNAHTLWAK